MEHHVRDSENPDTWMLRRLERLSDQVTITVPKFCSIEVALEDIYDDLELGLAKWSARC